MPLLEQQLLNNNAIKTLEPGTFAGLTLRFSNSNRIRVLAVDDFHSFRALEVLLIDNNVIENIEHGVFRDQEELRELTLGRLEYVYTLHLSVLFYRFPASMRITGLTSTRVTLCFVLPYFSNLESLEVFGNPEKVRVNYTGISQLRYLNFSNHTSPDKTFRNLKLFSVLVLYNCRLRFLTKRMFRDLQSLELLRLYSVSPLILHDRMFDVLPVLRAVVLDRVDFRCDCENGWLLEWAENT
ncbi:hypothetical protein NFI96_030524, partial [Prochilodus magdalenae]